MVGKGANFTYWKYTSHYMLGRGLQKMEYRKQDGFVFPFAQKSVFVLHRAP